MVQQFGPFFAPWLVGFFILFPIRFTAQRALRTTIQTAPPKCTRPFWSSYLLPKASLPSGVIGSCRQPGGTNTRMTWLLVDIAPCTHDSGVRQTTQIN